MGPLNCMTVLHNSFGMKTLSLASKAMEAMARQPEAAGSIRSSMIIALALMEALTIYGLLIAFMLIGKI